MVYMKKIFTVMKRLVLFLVAVMACCVGRAGDIPTVYITTADSVAITSRDHWLTGSRMQIVMPDGSVAYDASDVSVRARGNSTFGKPKKPYAIKLGKKFPILGMTANKRWVMLANFMDHSMLRNMLALSIAKQTSLAWTSDSRMVDVVVNGKPMGLYQICEQIKVGKNWVDADPDNGFLIEMDNYPAEKYRFATAVRKLPVNVKYPEDAVPEEMAEIEKYLNEIEAIIYGGETQDLSELYEKYIDINTFIDWWIVHELTQNAEPNGPRSCYMYKGRDGLLKAGPVWDFDLAFISVGLDAGGDIRPSRLNRTDVVLLTGDSIYNRNALWYDRLLSDPTFLESLKARWNELEPQFRALADEFDEWRSQIKASAEADEAIWKGQDPARFDTFTTFESSADNLKQTYLYRIDSLNRLIADLK